MRQRVENPSWFNRACKLWNKLCLSLELRCRDPLPVFQNSLIDVIKKKTS